MMGGMAEQIVVGRAASAEDIAREFSISPRRQAYLRAVVTGSAGRPARRQTHRVRRLAVRKKAARKA
jgi:hypothetical protein